MTLSPRARRMLRAPGGGEPVVPAEAVEQITHALAYFGAAITPAFAEFARTLHTLEMEVRGDGPVRELRMVERPFRVSGAADPHVPDGWVVPCLGWRGAGAHELCLHENGRVLDAGGHAHENARLIAVAASIQHWVEFESVVDGLADEHRVWWRITGRGPEGMARTIAERLDLAPFEEIADPFLGAWHRDGVRLRARREIAPEPRFWIDAFAAETGDADEIADAFLSLLGRAPSRQVWNPG